MKREIEIKRPLGRVLVPKIMIKQKVEDFKMTARHQFIKGLTPQRQRLPSIHVQQEQQRSISVKRQTQLTPIEFLEFISDSQYKQEFCYMTNCGGPYDWKIVDYANRDPNYYMTVSQRGVMIWRNGIMELQSYENFKLEKQYYSKLVRIDFFRNFIVSKLFTIWKMSIKQRKIMKYMQDVSYNLFVLDHIFLKAILNNYNYCYQIQSIYFFEQLNKSYSIKEFEIMIDEKLQKIQDLINQYRNQIFKNSSESCGYHYSKFNVRQSDSNKFSMQKDSVILSQEAETVDYDNNNGIIVQDNTRYIMHYTKKMKENEFKNKLSKYIIYCDQVLKETYIRYYQFNADIFIKCLQQTITSFNNFGWIVVEVEVQDQDFKFMPSKTEIEVQIFKFFDAIEKSIIDDDSQLFCLETRQNKQFLTVESSQPIKESLIEFIQESNTNKQYKQIIQSIIDQSFQLLYDNQNFIIEILKFESNRGESEIQLTLEYVKGTFQYYKDAFEQIQQVPVIQDLGLLQLNCSKIITNISNSLKRSSLDINLQFQKLIYNQIEILQLKINDIQLMIQNKPKNLYEFMQFQSELITTSNEINEVKPQIKSLQQIILCYQEYNQQIKQDISLQVEKLFIAMNQQVIRIHDVESSLFRLKERFLMELKQIIPSFESKIENLQETINTSEINYYGKEQDQLLAQIDQNFNKILQDYQQLQLFHQYLDQQPYENKNIYSLQTQIQLYKELWQGIKEFNLFINDLKRSHFLDIDVEQSLQMLQKYMQIFNQCITLSNDATKQFIEIIKYYFEVVESIKYLEMKKKSQIKAVYKFQQKVDEQLKLFDFQNLFDDPMNPLYTIQYIIEIKIYSLKQELKQLYDETIIENQLQEQLLVLDSYLDNQNFTTIRSEEFKDLLLIENCQQLHEISKDNINQIDCMLQNQLIGFIIQQSQQLLLRYQQLEQLTHLLKELEQQLLKSAYLVQTQYIIKHSQKDIRIQQIFQGVKKFWQKQILLCKQLKCLRNWIDGNFQQKIQSIQTQIEQLQILIRIIFDFIEQKRSMFPRLFLLSHQQYQEFILKPMVQLNNPIFLQRIFSNIQSISFDKYYGQINDIKGQNNETLCLKQCFIRGEYEEWLAQLDDYLKNYLKQTIKYAVSRIEFEEQSQMISQQYHLQILYLIYHIFFVKQIEDILIQESNQFEELYEQVLILNKNLIEFMQKEIQFYHRSAELLTTSIQRRDLIKQFLLLGISNINDYEWAKQIKYYLEDDIIHFKQLDLNISYCYEYYGDISIPYYLFDKQIIKLSQAFSNLQSPILLGNKSKHQVARTYGQLVGKFVFVYDFDECQEDIQNKLRGITQFQCMLILNQFDGDKYIIDIMKIAQAIQRTYQIGKQQQIECFGLNINVPLNQNMILISDKPLLQFRSINCFQIDFKYLFNLLLESRSINDFFICQSVNYFIDQYWFKLTYQFYQQVLSLIDNNIYSPQLNEIIIEQLQMKLSTDEIVIFQKFQQDIQQMTQQKQKVTKNQKKLMSKNQINQSK